MKMFYTILGLFIPALVIAGNPGTPVNHKVLLSGLQPNEARMVLINEYVNHKFRSGYYFCGRNGAALYDQTYKLPPSKLPFHEDHLIKFSLCQDERLVDCQEFATDKYLTFSTLDGYLENDQHEAKVDASPIKNNYQPCEPNARMDQLVKQSIHVSDRFLAHVG